MKDPISLGSYNEETDLQLLLINKGVEEGMHFEFKREFSGDVSKKLGKHVAAFANSHGGLLAVGVETDGIRAIGLSGIDIPNSNFQDSVAQRIVSTVRPIPLFSTKLIPLNESAKSVLLINIVESAYPPHLFDGMIYLREAAASDPVRPENRSEIDRLYEKAARTNVRFDEAIKQTWLNSLTWTNPSLHLISCPCVIPDNFVPDFDHKSLKQVLRLAEQIKCIPALHIASNEFRAKNTGDVESLRVTRYGLIEYIVEHSSPDEEVIFKDGTLFLESKLNQFLKASTEFYESSDYRGYFTIILGAREVKGKRTKFDMVGLSTKRKVKSYACERSAFMVTRQVSMGGFSDIIDINSRSEILAGIIREYVANFGTGFEEHCDAIVNLAFSDAEFIRWK